MGFIKKKNESIFKPGITGFHLAGQIIHRIEPDFVYLLVRNLNENLVSCRIQEVISPLADTNYYELKLQGDLMKGRSILLNSAYPVSCLIDNVESHWMHLKFMSTPKDMEDILKNQGVNVLQVEYLQTPVTQDELNKLAPVEYDQVEYWKSTTRGEILFNGYD